MRKFLLRALTFKIPCTIANSCNSCRSMVLSQPSTLIYDDQRFSNFISVSNFQTTLTVLNFKGEPNNSRYKQVVIPKPILASRLSFLRNRFNLYRSISCLTDRYCLTLTKKLSFPKQKTRFWTVPFSYLGSSPKNFCIFGELGVLLFQVRQVVFLVGVLIIFLSLTCVRTYIIYNV